MKEMFRNPLFITQDPSYTLAADDVGDVKTFDIQQAAYAR